MVEKKVEKKDVGDATHVMKLLMQVAKRIQDCYFEVAQRNQIREFMGRLHEGLQDMDKHDKELQEQPENKKKNLRAELIQNDELLKKNKEKKREQIQMGLFRKGYPQSSPFYDTLLESQEMDIEDFKIKIDSGFRVINPVFEFQDKPDWIKLQLKLNKRKLKATEANYKEITKNVEEVKKEIVEQNERMKTRRVQIIEELKKLKVDVTEFSEKPPDYIG